MRAAKLNNNMKNKPMKYLKIGIVVYLIYAVLVISVVKDEPSAPEDMDWRDRQTYNLTQIGKLELGNSRTQVIEQLGSPDISEARQLDDATFSVLYYRTQHRESDGETSKDECTWLFFKNDLLVAWGESQEQLQQQRAEATMATQTSKVTTET